jgi:HAE1 family hydrophobic/amphiphilic exporter-1
MLLLSMMVLGVVAIFRLPLDFMPLIKEPEVDIEVPYPGSHPLETLRDVALPIEEEVATIPNVKRIHTRSDSDSTRIEVQFDWGETIELKRMEVREAVERARDRLPEEIGFIQVQGEIAGPADGATLQGRISAERDLSESWELLDRRIKRPIERIKGVASVSLYGVEPQQVHVELDLDALKHHGIRAADVLARINAANVDMDLGTVRGDVIRYDVRALGRFRGLDEIRNLSLGKAGLRVRDVADVSLREPVLTYGRHLDRRFAIGIDVAKEPTANTVETVDRIIERIGEIEKDPALKGIKLLVWANAGEEIRSSLAGLRDAGIFGGFLAVAVLYFFLRRLRTTLIVAVAIPFSLVVTCGAMYLLGSEFNVLTLLGLMLGVGMLVDNAVVVMENIHRLQSRGMDPKTAAKEGVRDVALAVTASTATTVIVWSWLFAADKSEMTIMMVATALTICLAVACSLLISLTFIPLAAARFVPNRSVRPGFLVRRLVPAYRALLAWTLRHRFAALTALLLLASSAVYPLRKLEKSGEPKMQEYSVQINYRVHDPSTKEVLERYVNQVEGWLEERKEELGYDSMYSWFAENRGVMTRLYLPRGRATKHRLAEMRRKLERELPTIAGVKLEVGDREWWRHGSQGRRMVSVELHGEDPEYLEDLALRAEQRLREIPNALEVYGPSLRGQKEARILVDPDKARLLGVTPRAVAESVAFAFRGRRLRRFQQESGEIEMVVGIPEEVKETGLAVLNDLQIPVRPDAAPTTDGEAIATVPLSSVAEIGVARMPPQIRRTDRKTTSRVSVQFDEQDVTTEEAQTIVRAKMTGFELPEGYDWDFGTWGQRQEEALTTMTQGVLLSLLIVLLLMAALFESFTQPLAILITLPLAFFGALWTLWLGGYELDAIGFIGIIILIGIVVNNGIVMVDHVNSLRRSGRERVEALLEGCGNRLRPVLMTAITTIFGLLPLALAGATVAGAYIDSLAIAVIGGLATSTFFTLIALPVWYTAVEDVGSVLLRLLPRRAARSRATSRLPKGGVLVDRV